MPKLFSKWDIVFVAVPNQENPTAFTNRPAIILAVNNDNTVKICPITTKVHQADRYNHTILVPQGSPESFDTNLRQLPSLIVLDRIERIPVASIKFPFGTCPQVLIDRIEKIINRDNC